MRLLQPSIRRRRWFFRTLIGCALLTPPALVALWLLLHHIPGWYEPVLVPDARLDDLRADAANTYSWIGDGIVYGQRFDLVLDEGQVTEWLSAGERLWPDAEEWVPGWLEDPVIRFRDGRIIVGARLHWEGKELIGGVHLLLQVAEDEMLVLRLTRVTSGSLPLPVAWFAGPISGLVRMENRDLGLLPAPAADLVKRFRESEPLQLLSQGVRRANRFIWENGRRPYRIAAVRAEHGKLTFTIDPL